MKIITLNLWAGTVYEPLMRFVESHSEDVGVFCFQEMLFGSKPGFTEKYKARINIFEEIQKRLPEFEVYKYYAPEGARYFQDELLPEGVWAGQTIFVRKGIKVLDNGGFRTYIGKEAAGMTFGGKITGSCQWVEIEINGERMLVLNLHGLWQRNSGKIDTPERLVQSQVLQDFIKAKGEKTVLCGDFNLIPDGQSMQSLEEGLVNLIKESGVTSTRSSYYNKPVKLADYILISPEIQIKNFLVLPDEVSDHLPLSLELV
jgi:exonuclease III